MQISKRRAGQRAPLSLLNTCPATVALPVLTPSASRSPNQRPVFGPTGLGADPGRGFSTHTPLQSNASARRSCRSVNQLRHDIGARGVSSAQTFRQPGVRRALGVRGDSVKAEARRPQSVCHAPTVTASLIHSQPPGDQMVRLRDDLAQHRRSHVGSCNTIGGIETSELLGSAFPAHNGDQPSRDTLSERQETQLTVPHG